MEKKYINEIWRPIKGYEGLYEVSNLGRIKSLKFGKERIMKLGTNSCGYLHIGLYKNGKRKIFLVHRLVMEAFTLNTDNLPFINHKDENKQNNNVNNLEWCTVKYNNTYGTRIERGSKKLSKPVLQYTLDGEFVREWKSTAECGRNGFNQAHIWMCCKGKQKYHKNFIWRYK